jgi:hypothetical protein
MLKDIRWAGDHFAAEGPKYDLDRVMPTAFSMVRALIGRSAMAFGASSPAYRAAEGPSSSRYPYDDEAELRLEQSHLEHRRYWDLDPSFAFFIAFPPLCVSLMLLGAARGPWTEGEPAADGPPRLRIEEAPMVSVFAIGEPVRPMTAGERRVVLATFEGYRASGIDIAVHRKEGKTLLALARFRDDAYATGVGELRIRRVDR